MRSGAGRPNGERAPSRTRVWSASLCLALIAGLTLFPAAAAHAASFVVTDAGDSGPGTFRQAILDANANPGPDVITFNVGGGGGAISATIAPTSPLPAITDATTVDGLSQAGSSCSAWPPTLLIRIDGLNAGVAATGLTVAGGDGTTIRGLVIRRFQGDGVSISAPATATTVTCDAIGTSSTGAGQFGNGGAGIAVRSTGAGAGASITNNMIMNSGGPGVLVDPDARLVSIRGNRIDANGGVGIDLVAAGGDPNGDGPTPNTATGQGLGGNDLQFAPALSTAVNDAGGTRVEGSLTSAAPATAAGQYVVDLYSSASCDAVPAPGGSGEGATPIGSVSVPATDASAPGTFSFTVTGLTGAGLGRFVTATATDGSGTGNTSEFSACAQVVPASSTPSANLSLTGTATPDPVTGGGAVTYVFTVLDSGPDPSDGVTVTDVLPPGVQPASMSASVGSCSAAVATVTCDLGTVSAGVANGSTVTIVATSDDVTAMLLLVDRATVTATTPDPVAGDNQVTITSSVQPRVADLSITKTGPATVTAGDTFSYTIGVANAGPDAAHAVAVADALPAGVSYVGATPTAGSCAESAGTVTCDLGTLASGGSASIDLVVRADPVTGPDPVVVSNVASVTSDRPDPSPDDDTTPAVITTVTPAATDPDLELTSVANVPNPVTGGYDLGYSATITNLGPGDAKGVVLSDTFAPGESFVAGGSDPSCTATALVVTCAIGPLTGEATRSIQIVTKTPVVASDTAMADTFVVTSPQDTTPANDVQTVTTTVRPRRTDFAAAYIPPSRGPSWVVDATAWIHGDPVATNADPTIVQVGIPGGGPGGPVTITERPCGAPFVCATRRSASGTFFPAPGVFGSIVTITVPHGYPASNPFSAVITDDWSLVGPGWDRSKVSYQDDATGAFTAQLANCRGWQHASPPCVTWAGRIGAWWNPWFAVDLRTAVLFTADATFGRGR